MVNLRKGVSFVLFVSIIDKYAVGFRMYPLKGKSSISSSQLYTQSQTNNQIRKRNFATNRTDSSIYETSSSTRRPVSLADFETKNAPPKPPLVDSTLLRFLSLQKAGISTTENDESASNEMNGMMCADTINETMLSSLDQTNGDEEAVVVEEEVSTRGYNNENTDANTVSWLTQYNSNIITNKLIALGADKASASEAGRIVQKHVLSKTTRQRMKKFLRDRNSLWTASQPTDFTNGTVIDSSNYFDLSNMRSEALLRGNSYNFDQLLEYLSDAGLAGKDISSILIHTPSISTMKVFANDKCASESSELNDDLSLETLNGTLNKSFRELLTSRLKLRKYDARKVLRTCPGLLTKSGSESAEQVITILSGLGVSESSLARDKRILPLLLSRKPSSLFQLVAFLSSDVIRMPMSSIGPLIRKPGCSILLDIVAPVYRKDFVELADSNAAIERDELLSTFSDKIQKCNGSYESIVSGTLDRLYNSKVAFERKRITKAYNVMTETAIYLRERVGISDLGKILSAYPTLLCFDVKSQIAPVVRFLEETVGIENRNIPLILQSYPALLGKNVDDLEEVVDFLQLLDVDGESLESIIRAFPSLLTVDVEETMIPVVEFLRSIGISNIGRFITRLPPVLGYSVENELEPKWKYLKSVSQYYGFEVMRFPAYFSYPLERVIKTRYEYLIKVKKIPVGLLPIDDVLRYGDSDFAKKVAGDTDSGASFLKFASERQSIRKPSKAAKQLSRGKAMTKVKKTASKIRQK